MKKELQKKKLNIEEELNKIIKLKLMNNSINSQIFFLIKLKKI